MKMHKGGTCNAKGTDRPACRYWILACQRNIGVCAGTDDLLGGMGSGELPAGTRQRVRERKPASRSPSRPRRGRTSRPRPSPNSTPRATPTTWSSATRSGSAPASDGGHYVDLTDFFNKHKLTEVMAPATVKYYAEYPGNSGKYWSIPARGRRGRLVLSQGLVRRSEGNGSLQGQVRLRPRRAEGLEGSCATSPSSSIVPTRSATASPSTPTIPMTRW